MLFCYTHPGRVHLYLAFVTQGLFPPAGFIPSLLFSSTGIILPRSDASLSSSFAPQGLFLPPRFISILLFCSTGIISAGRIHPYLPLLSHRDYFHRPDASLSCSFAPQGLFPPAECISIFLFCPTGIILPRSDASLIRAPVKYQRPNFYYTGNTRMASADTLCKKLLPDRQK